MVDQQTTAIEETRQAEQDEHQLERDTERAMRESRWEQQRANALIANQAHVMHIDIQNARRDETIRKREEKRQLTQAKAVSFGVVKWVHSTTGQRTCW